MFVTMTYSKLRRVQIGQNPYVGPILARDKKKIVDMKRQELAYFFYQKVIQLETFRDDLVSSNEKHALSDFNQKR